MKRFVASLVSAALATVGFLAISEPADAVGFRSTYGTDFWVHWDENYDYDASVVPSLSLAGAANGTATITWPDGSQETVAISAGTVAEVDATVKIKNATKYVTGSDVTGTFAARVQSDVAINVYLSNLRDASSDAAIAYPTSYLGTTYRVLTPPGQTDNGPERFSVTATEAGTTNLTVTLAAGSTNTAGKPVGTPYSVQLNQGETYTLAGNELAGTLLDSDKKIAVSASIKCARFDQGACDHVTDFMPPVQTWGTNYIIPSSRNSVIDDVVWVMANEDGTDVSVNGGAPSTLQAGQVMEIFTSGTNALAVNYRTLTSTKPVLVLQGLNGGSYSSSSGNQVGDPAVVVIQPTVQFLNDALFSTPASGFAVNYVVVVAKTAEVNNGSLKLDDVAVTPADFTGITGTDYSVGRLDISVGTHRLTSTTGFATYVTGFGNYNSYAYSGGSGLVNLVQYPGGVEEVGYQSVEEIIQNVDASGDVSRDVERAAPYNGPIVTVNPNDPATNPGAKKQFPGMNLDLITKVVIDGKEVKFTVVNGTLEIEVPAGLDPGTYNMTVSGTFGSLVVQDALTIVGAAAMDIGKKMWTNINAAKTSVRVVYKNPVGVGKVQFMLNGKELAWVQAADESDPKLRSYTLNGVEIPYLVRNVELTPGIKNAFEIYVDGKRVWRAAYYSAD